MGCYAAINALKLARHIVRSEPEARVLVVNLELCTLHLKETHDLEKLLSFCLWGDGCAAALVTAEPHGLRLDSFHAVVAPERRELMTWNIRDDGFDMVLSGQVPAAIQEIAAQRRSATILGGRPVAEIDLWAVHPGGRSVLDAVERALGLGPTALDDIARSAAGERQHVVGDGDVRAGADAEGRRAGLTRLRHGVRAGPDRRDDDVPDGVMSACRKPRASPRRAGNPRRTSPRTIRGRSPRAAISSASTR